MTFPQAGLGMGLWISNTLSAFWRLAVLFEAGAWVGTGVGSGFGTGVRVGAGLESASSDESESEGASIDFFEVELSAEAERH